MGGHGSSPGLGYCYPLSQGEGRRYPLFSAKRPQQRPAAGLLSGVLLLSALFVLAACSSSGLGSRNASTPTEFQPVSGEVLGTGKVRVAMLLPLSATGNAGQIGLNIKNAATLALREFQNADIQIMIKDDRGTADGARAAASEAIAQGAELILGPLFAQSVAAAASVAKPARVPIVAFSTDTSAASNGVYLLSFLPQSDVDRIIQFATLRGKRAFAALLPANGYGTVVEAALHKAVADRGGRIIAIERYQLDRFDMQAKAQTVAAIANAGQIDSIFMPDAGDAAPFLAQILSTEGVRTDKVAFLGSGQWNADERVVGESNLSGAWYPAPDNAGFESFSSRYRAQFGNAPFRPASLGYDAASLAAGLTSRFGDQRFSPETLTNSAGFLGVDGAFRLLPNGTNQRGLAIYQIDKGKAQIIEPAPTNFGS